MKLGDVLRDKISGFTGIATSKVEFLNGCVRFALAPQELREGKLLDSQYFDQEQLEVVTEAKPGLVKRLVAAVGGDRPNPQDNPNPR